jgi:hypothetical protein
MEVAASATRTFIDDPFGPDAIVTVSPPGT